MEHSRTAALLVALSTIFSYTVKADVLSVNASVSSYDRVINQTLCSDDESATSSSSFTLFASCSHIGPLVSYTAVAGTTNTAGFETRTASQIDPLNGGVFLLLGADLSGVAGSVTLHLDGDFVFSGINGPVTPFFEIRGDGSDDQPTGAPPPDTECVLSLDGSVLTTCPSLHHDPGRFDVLQPIAVELGETYHLTLDISMEGTNATVSPFAAAISYNFVLPDGVSVALVPEPSSLFLLATGVVGVARWMRLREKAWVAHRTQIQEPQSRRLV